ncbi:uncharacterized protein [Antennarius striatus]|uniref:uncharacterized protein n=1 Tax=Antennarius striatus TaxID=241820 RepID=UPI0035B2443A
MRSPALCVCGTLLAFSSLLWTTVDSDEGDLQKDYVFGPCSVTLRPEGLCQQDQDGDTCSYLISLPPLTVHLPKQLRELERIVKDLQNLKDNVDQLRKMCADCTVSQTKSEHEKRNDGMERHVDERIWLNDRNNDKQKDFIQDYGTIRGTVTDTMEGLDNINNEERASLDEKLGLVRESERKTVIEPVKENDDESVQVTKTYGNTQADGSKGKDQLEQATMPSAYGNGRIADTAIKNNEQNNRERETTGNKQKYGKVNSTEDRQNILFNDKLRKITTNIQNNKTEEGEHHKKKHETKKTEKKIQTDDDRGSDGVKMSEDHDKHTNKEKEKHEEQMKKGIKVDQRGKPKQTESTGHTEKEKIIKEGEVQVEKNREIGEEIKNDEEKPNQSVQRDYDGGFRKSTDFVSINPTPYSSKNISHDSKQAITSESPPRFPASSSKSLLSLGIDQWMAVTADGLLVTNIAPGAARISVSPSTDMEADFRTTSRLTKAVQESTVGGPLQQITSDTTRFTSTTSAGPQAGLQRQVGHPTMATATTVAPLHNLNTTIFPGPTEHSSSSSSNTMTSVDLLAVQETTPAGKNKSATKPKASRKQKTKNGHKSDQAPLPNKTKKTKFDQKQRTSNQKPTTNKKNKPAERLTKAQLQKPNLDSKIPKQERTNDESHLPIQKPKSQKPALPVQNTVNATSSDKDSLPDQDPEPVEITTVDQNLRSDEDQKPGQKPKPHQKSIPPVLRPTSHQKPKTAKSTDSDQVHLPDQDPEPVETTTVNQNMKPVEKLVRQKNEKPDRKPKPRQMSTPPVQRPTSHQKPRTANATGSDKDAVTYQEAELVEITTVNQNFRPDEDLVHLEIEDSGQKPTLHQESTTPFQRQSPHQKPKTVKSNGSDQDLEILVHQKTKEPDQKPKSHQKFTVPVQRPTPHQKPKTIKATGSDQDFLTDQEPESVEITNVNQNLKPDEKLVHLKTEEPGQKPKPNQKSAPPVQRPPHQKPKTVKSTGSDQDLLNEQEPESVENTTVNQNLRPDEDLVNFKTEKPGKKPKPHQMSTLPVQRPTPHEKPKTKATGSDQDLLPDQDPEPVESTTVNQNLKPDEDVVHLKIEKPGQKPKPKEIGKNFTSSINQKPVPELMKDFDENEKLQSAQDLPTGQKLTSDHAVITTHEENQKHAEPTVLSKSESDVTPKPGQKRQRSKAPQNAQMPPISKSVPDDIHVEESRVTPRQGPPTRPTVQPGKISTHKSNPSVKPGPKTTSLLPSHITRITQEDIQNIQTDTAPPSGYLNVMTHSPGDTVSSPDKMKTITLNPKTSYNIETKPLSHHHIRPEGFTMSPNSRIISDLRPQTASQPPSITVTRRPNKIMPGILPTVIPRVRQGSQNPNQVSSTLPKLQLKEHHNVEETVHKQTTDPPQMLITVPSPKAQSSSTSPDLRPKNSVNSGLRSFVPESSTESARELRVKINQVAAFLNNSLKPNGRPVEHPTASRAERTDVQSQTSKPPKAVTMTMRDCTDYLLRGETKSGVYVVTPDLRSRSFAVYCDMELDGGGWALLQRRQDGSVNFNRTWSDYRSGFGKLDGGEFWLGNNMIHLLTRDRDVVLHVELEDFEGVKAYARYKLFKVASERLRYRLTVGEYSGTAGDALRFNKRYDHNNRSFTTPDRDHDRYPSGNCGAYYSSGWWFDACMASNLNGRYYVGKYKGVRDGIFWGTWHNINKEHYPTNERQSFKSVRMMIRPKGFTR